MCIRDSLKREGAVFPGSRHKEGIFRGKFLRAGRIDGVKYGEDPEGGEDLTTGEFISQEIYDPNPETIDVFYTSDEGWLMLPEQMCIRDRDL